MMSGLVQPWRVSDRADPAAASIADRHYNRQKPGSAQFVPPGRCLVLRATGPAVWVTSWPFAEYVRHDWPGAWVNSLFRREGGPLASELIRAAVAATRAHWPDVPEPGIVSFVDPSKVREKRDPGYCYLRAGFRLVGRTRGGLLAFQMLREDMPPPAAAIGSQGDLLRQSPDLAPVILDGPAAAVELELPLSTVRRWVAEGRLTTYGKDRRGRTLLDLDEVERVKETTRRGRPRAAGRAGAGGRA